MVDYPPLRSMFWPSLVSGGGALTKTGLPLILVIGTVSADMDFFRGGGWSPGDTEVGITGIDFSMDIEVVIMLGESSATDVRVVWPFVGGEDREPGEDSPPCEVLALVVVRGDTRPTYEIIRINILN